MKLVAGLKSKLWLLIPLFVGILAALFAWFVLQNYLRQTEMDLQQQYRRDYQTLQTANERVAVVVPAQALAAGEQLTAKNMRVRQVNPDALAADAILAQDAESIIGRVLRTDLATDLVAGRPLQRIHLLPYLDHRLSSRLGELQTAFSFRVNDEDHHGNALHIGDRIDLYTDAPGGTQLLASALEVLAIDGRLQDGEQRGGMNVITVAIPLTDVMRFHQAYHNQTLQVFLRPRQHESGSPRRLQGNPTVEWIFPSAQSQPTTDIGW